MNVSDINIGRVLNLDLRVSGGAGLGQDLVKSEVFLHFEESGECRVEIGEELREAEGAGPADRDALHRIAVGALPRLAWVAQANNPAPRRPVGNGSSEFLIQVHEFPSRLAWDEVMEVGVDDQMVDDLRKRIGRSISVASAVKWFDDRMLLPPRRPSEPRRALLSGSPTSAEGRNAAFRLHGAGFAVDVQRDTNDRLRATRVVTRRRRVADGEGRPIHLVTGPIGFCDMTVAGQFRGVARTELDTLVAQADSYLGLWEAYNKKEGEAVLRRAREFGWIGYARTERLPNGDIRFHLNAGEGSDLRERLDVDETLEAGRDVPEAIRGLAPDEPVAARADRFTCELATRQAAPASVTVRPSPEQDSMPPERGFLFVALGGHSKRLERRRNAWERIRGCANPMPQLGLIIEGQSVRQRRGRHLTPVTKAVREVFTNPTERQRRALEVALNTPDIALIQGPPGTGKTRVIAALQARLAEADESIDPDGLQGNTLLTSFQHDAVENAAAATRVMGLPAVKVGYRRGSVQARDGVDAWSVETAQAVRAARGSAPRDESVHAALRSIREIALTYFQTPSRRDEPAEVLRQVSEAAGAWLPAELIDEIARLQAELTAPKPIRLADGDRDFALRAIRALRTNATAFSDDGPANAHKVIRRLARLEGVSGWPPENTSLLTTDARSCLERAAACEPGVSADERLLADLESVRNGLLDRLDQASVEDERPRVHADVETLVSHVIDALKVRSRETAPGADIAVDEWLTDLEKDPVGIRNAVRQYSMVLAATCQQSVSWPMAEAKGGDDTVFRTVIVDEAARSNPLDLLIPMACAERRIVLVGDHRQLPHLLEPEVEREIEGSSQAETQSVLRQSLFEKLFRELRKRERSDGIQRAVTLNTQFRMHPLLGRFICEQFYARHGEQFGSGRSERGFGHEVALKDGVSLSGKVAAWIDVPSLRGGERSGRSKRRPVEAQRVAEEACGVVTGHPGLSVGVITFYGAQRDEILEAMSAAGVGLTEPDDEGGYRIRDEWLRTGDGRERLRVGTVDAFQGKEFDVVFLSLTRSNKIAVNDDAARRRRYGFLLLENRLCVAMSRQKRLLVVIGDREMAAGPEAEASVPGLSGFLELCGGQHGCIVRA